MKNQVGWRRHVNENAITIGNRSVLVKERNYGTVGWNERIIIDHGLFTSVTMLKIYSVPSNYPLFYLPANISKM